jgi:hypothetical protein
MFDRLRSELKAIQGWIAGGCPTDSEKIAVIFRVFRATELTKQIEEIVSRN